MTPEEIIRGTGLSREDLDALWLLEKAAHSKPCGQECLLSVKEKNCVVAFLEKSIGNMECNQQLLELGKLEHKDTGVSFYVLSALRNIPFKSRSWHRVRFNDKDKITLPQLGILFDLASLTRDLTVFEQLGLLDSSSSLYQLYHDAQQAKKTIGTLEKFFPNALNNSPNTLFLEIKATKGAPMFPNKHYRKDEFVLTEFLYSEEYRIKLDKLIKDEETKNYLKKHLGPDWLRQLENKFAVIQRQLHDAQLIGPIHSGITRQDSSSFEHCHAEDQGAANLICSPFVGICTINSIKELNAQIVKELQKRGEKKIPLTLLQLPVTDKLEALSPSHFLDALKKSNALARVHSDVATVKEPLSDTHHEDQEDPPTSYSPK